MCLNVGVYWLAWMNCLDDHHSHSVRQFISETHGSVNKRSALLQTDRQRAPSVKSDLSHTCHPLSHISPSDRRWARLSWKAIWPGWWLSPPPAARQHRTPAVPLRRPAAPSRRKPWWAAGQRSRWAEPIREETMRVGRYSQTDWEPSALGVDVRFYLWVPSACLFRFNLLCVNLNSSYMNGQQVTEPCRPAAVEMWPGL